jgi:hypothetical protein
MIAAGRTATMQDTMGMPQQIPCVISINCMGMRFLEERERERAERVP